MIRKLMKIFAQKKYQTSIFRYDTSNNIEYEGKFKKILNLLNYTKKSNVSYSAGKFDAGYHSFKINDHFLKGQRDPQKRFQDLPFSLEHMTILDVGCNQGGMLHAFSDKIKHGIGIDYDPRMVNVANKIRSYKQTTNLDFYVFNLETEDLDYILDFLPEENVDLVLLLSVCMWINNWKDVISFLSTISKKMVFESNGSPQEQQLQYQYLAKIYRNVKLIHERSEDDDSQKFRKLYYCY